MVKRRDFSFSMLALLAGCGGSDGGDGPGPIDPVDPPDPLGLALSPVLGSDGLTGQVTLEATGGSAVAAVQFQVDGVDLGGEVTGAPFTKTIDSSAWASGQHVLAARARDAAGSLGNWTLSTVRFGGTRVVPGGWTLDDTWVTGLDSATAFAAAPDGRFYVAQQGGALRVVRNGVLLDAPFVTRTVDSRGERGLLGVAVHPDFQTDHGVYVYYTVPGDASSHNRIARFTAGAGDQADGDEDAFFDLPALSDAQNHNGGALVFGTDGTLFVGVGDNADGAQSQDPNLPFGKILRLDSQLGIPADNPTAGSAVWARGLRNPFTLAVQPGTGKLYINDVGQNTWEEIDEGAAGANYGWPDSEGFDRVGTGVTAPVYAYGHADASPPGTGQGGFFIGNAIAGGAFVGDVEAFPESLRRRYLFADFVSGFVAALDPLSGEASTFATVAGNPVGLSVGTDGAVYVLLRDRIVRIAQEG